MRQTPRTGRAPGGVRARRSGPGTTVPRIGAGALWGCEHSARLLDRRRRGRGHRGRAVRRPRRWPGPWVPWAGRTISLVLAVDALVFIAMPVVNGEWSVDTSLPLALCHVALVIAVLACWWPGWLLGVELTYFWGLAGTAQAVITPDLNAGFPEPSSSSSSSAMSASWSRPSTSWSACGSSPRRGSVLRVFAITLAYAAFVGVFNWLTGANYMYLAAPPRAGVFALGARTPALVHTQRGRRRPRPAAAPGRAVPPGAAQTARRRP